MLSIKWWHNALNESHQPLVTLIFLKPIQKNLAVFPAFNSLLDILNGNHSPLPRLYTKHAFTYSGVSSLLGSHKALSWYFWKKVNEIVMISLKANVDFMNTKYTSLYFVSVLFCVFNDFLFQCQIIIKSFLTIF